MCNNENPKQPLKEGQEITKMPLKKRGAEIPAIQQKPPQQNPNSQSDSNQTSDSGSDKE